MFDEKKYSNAQLKAVTSADSNLLLVAGPGSGKTHTMTGRILYLTEKLHVSSSEILVITFTKDAALGMQKRYNSSCDSGFGVCFGTFHSVFYHMICEYKKDSLPNLIFDKAKLSITKNIAEKYLGPDGNLSDCALRIISAVSIYKNTLDSEKAAVLLPEKLHNDFKRIFDHYENIRKKKNLMDFDDMVYDCLELLKNSTGFKNRWSKRFKYILIDEFQDINTVQYETVKLLAGNSTKVFAVGDDDQSIYGFRGSDPSCIKKYIEEMNAEILFLDTNYRSTDIIVSSSLKVIDEGANRIKKNLKSEKKGTPEDVEIKPFNDSAAQYAEIIRMLKIGYDNTAVLFRTNLDMQQFASYLTKENIPYIIREKTTSIYEHFILQDIYAYFEAAYLNDSCQAVKSIINTPNRYIGSEAVITGGGNIDETIRFIAKNKGIKNPLEKIRNLNILKNDLNFMKKMSPHYALEYLYNKIGYRKYVLLRAGSSERLTEEYRQILDNALKISMQSNNYDELILLRSAYEEDLKKSKKKESGSGVNLMTLHSSKGLEFNTVFIPDCNEGTIPYGKMQDAETIEEERRLFYVGMTRAIARLHIYYISVESSENRIPSRFIYPLTKK